MTATEKIRKEKKRSKYSLVLLKALIKTEMNGHFTSRVLSNGSNLKVNNTNHFYSSRRTKRIVTL